MISNEVLQRIVEDAMRIDIECKVSTTIKGNAEHKYFPSDVLQSGQDIAARDLENTLRLLYITKHVVEEVKKNQNPVDLKQIDLEVKETLERLRSVKRDNKN